MNALPSFEPPSSPPPRRKSRRSQQATNLRQANSVIATPASPISTETRTRVKSKQSLYAYRRQGLEAMTKLVTYSVLSAIGMVTVVNSIGYNWSQQGKLQHLQTELQDARARAAQTNNNFSRSFDPQLQQKVMQENSYKVAPDRRQLLIVTHPTDRSAPTPPTEVGKSTFKP
jgi:flagellar hook protein FlgE